nr:disease resistance protein [Tanacetum cinerariifolium]
MIKVASGVFRVNETEESWHDGLMNLRKWTGRWNNVGKGSRQNGSVTSGKRIGSEGWARGGKCPSSGIFITSSGNDLEHFIPNKWPEKGVDTMQEIYSDIQKDCLLENWAAEELLDASDVELHREIGNLQKLEVLDIRGSGLKNIPPQVESLISLRRLLVSFTISMSIHPTQKATNEVEVISKIPMLKELVVDVKDGLERILYGAIVDVVRLTRLSLLHFCFSNKVVDHIKAIGGTGKLEDLFS